MRFASALAWHAEQLAGEFHRQGHDVLLMCMRDSPLSVRTDSAPYLVHRLLRPTRLSPGELFLSISEVRKVLREFCPDVLNPHCSPGHSFLSALRGSKETLPLVRTVAEPRPPKHHLLNRRLYKHGTDALIYTTKSSQKRFESIGSELPSQTVVLPGFRAEEFVQGVIPRGIRAELGLSSDVILVGVIARMSPEKGQEVLIRALSKLRSDEQARFHIVMAGEDSRERGFSDLQAIAAEHGVENRITFLGKLDDVRPLMSALDLGVITSTRSEAICRVALEYMSFGLPVISSDTNILPEVVTAENSGWIFANESHDQLANILREIVSNRDELKRRGAIGLITVRERLTLRGEAEKYVDIFARARHAVAAGR